MDRRQFLSGAAALTVTLATARTSSAEQAPSGDWGEAIEVAGDAKQRGRAYGEALAEPIRAFHEREIASAFVDKPNSKQAMLDYAAACGKKLAEACPIVSAEIDGMAETCGLSRDELMLTQLHEELYHRGVIPSIDHCTAVAAGPPSTADGRTYCGQTWDWMQTVFGTSRVVRWRREKEQTLLGYGFPGLWAGAGLNSDGIALCWTSAGFHRGPKPNKDATPARVGIPSYALIAHLLYQPTLDDVEREARRDLHAGWFTFVMADGQGNLLNLEGSPRGIVVERGKGHMARVDHGARETLAIPAGEPIPRYPRCQKMLDLLDASAGKIDGAWLKKTFADPECKIQVGKSTIDMMVFDCTKREAHVSRGPAYGGEWRGFGMG